MKKFDEPFESDGGQLLTVERDPKVVVDHTARRNCPGCPEKMIMMRHFSSVKKEAEVDVCPKCNGIWLDAGELNSIREAFSSEKEKVEATQKFLGNMFDTKFDEMRKENEAERKTSKTIYNIFKFICPSNYMK